MINESIQKNDFGSRVVLRPATMDKINEETSKCMDEAMKEGVQAVLLVSSSVRVYVKGLSERSFPRLPVLSFNEVVSDVEIQSLGLISSEVLM